MVDGIRTNISEGQELVYADLNKISSRIEKHMFDRIILEVIQRTKNAFFGNSFKAVFASSTSVYLQAGSGFQEDLTVDASEPVQRPMYLAANQLVTLGAPNPTNPRIDIICVKSAFINGAEESRKYKDEATEVISDEDFVTSKDYSALYVVVAGVPDPAPVAGAVPAGYIKVATCLVTDTTGMADQAAITDERSLMPMAGVPTATGNNDFDAVVGNLLTFGVTHATLKAALDDATDDFKILVLESEDIDDIPVVNNNNVEIVFKRGVTFTKDGVVRGLQIDANDCKVVNGRFLDFSTAGDEGIRVSAGSLRIMLRDNRFNNCDTNVNDLGTKTTQLGLVTE